MKKGMFFNDKKNAKVTVDTTRIKPFSTYVCTGRIFDSPQYMFNKIFLKKSDIEVGTSHIYASFGTFCNQIGQLFEHSRHSESLKSVGKWSNRCFRRKMPSISNSSESL